MAFVINAFTVRYDQYLGGLMDYAKFMGHQMRDFPVIPEIQQVKIRVLYTGRAVQSALCHTARGTGYAVLENNLWPLIRLLY
jgi:hypothetical protein